MKKTLFIWFAAISCITHAQNSKVSSADMHMEDFIKSQDTNDLLQAKQAIDDAAVNDKTKDEPKMYLYRGEVYLMLFQMKFFKLASKSSPSEAYTNVDTTNLCISANSFMKVLEISSKDFYADETKQKQNMPACVVHIENKALMDYNAKKYASALALYDKAIAMDNLLGINDSTYSENVLLAAEAADKAGNELEAVKYYLQVISMKTSGSAPYIKLVNMYLGKKDTAIALDYLGKGKADFPDDLQLVITETNIYLAKNNFDKAEADLMLTISKVEARSDKDKNKQLLASLYSTLGNLYDKKANPKDASGQDAPKPANYEDLFTKAETNYNKALGVTPDNADLLFITGALYFNRGVGIAKEAGNLPLSAQDKYDNMQKEAKTWFLKAQPLFEKAHQKNPNDQSTINALKQLYMSTGQDDKAKALGGN